MSLVRFTPFHSNFVQTPVSKFYNWPFANLVDFVGNENSATVPAVNVKETASAYHIEVAAPGLKKENFSINVERSLLTITGSQSHNLVENNQTENNGSTNTSTENQPQVKTEGENVRFIRREYHFSAFERSFKLPNSVDTTQIQAAYADGILSITLPKKGEDNTNLKTRITIA